MAPAPAQSKQVAVANTKRFPKEAFPTINCINGEMIMAIGAIQTNTRTENSENRSMSGAFVQPFGRCILNNPIS